jgi:Domain of unknown function (DUF4249)
MNPQLLLLKAFFSNRLDSHIYLKYFFTSVTLVLFFTSCEVLFEGPNKNNLDLISVDATLVDTLNGPPIRLSLSKVNKSSSTSAVSYISGATIEIIENNESKIQFIESDIRRGYYFPPKTFYAKDDKKYSLDITLPDGSSYFSSEESLPKTQKPKVEAILSKAVVTQTGIVSFKGDHNIFIDLADPQGEENYYKVDYRYFEEQEFCDRTPNPPIVITPCRYMCWDFFENTDEHILRDKFSDGKTIKNFNIGSIPYNQPFPALVQISVYGISKSAFEYWKVIQDQTEKTGTLADTPPTAFLGNLNSKKTESAQIIGYFQLARQSKINYMLDRSDIKNEKQGSFVYPNFVFERLYYAQPPYPCIRGFSCKCKEGYERTSALPEGWPLPTRRVLQPDDYVGE